MYVRACACVCVCVCVQSKECTGTWIDVLAQLDN